MVMAPAAILGCIYLFFSLDSRSILLFLIWAAIGLVVYFAYSRSRSHVGRGIGGPGEAEVGDLDPPVPGSR